MDLRIVGGVITFAVFFYSIIQIVSRKKQTKPKPVLGRSESTLNRSEDTVLFSTEGDLECNHENNVQSCCRMNCYVNNIRHIAYIIRNAKESVDIAVYCFLNYELSSAIIDAVGKQVRVRIIVDAEKFWEVDRDPLLRIIQVGGNVRWKTLKDAISVPRKMMHHKFALVDGKLLVTGSMDWSKEDAIYNSEEAAVISQPSIVNAFRHEFERLWDEVCATPEEQNGDLAECLPVSSCPTKDWKTDAFHGVFMLGEHTASCAQHFDVFKAPREEASHRLYCGYIALCDICDFIEAPDRSVSACFPSLTLCDVTWRLNMLHQIGVAVQIITDYRTSPSPYIQYLSDQGLDVRSKAQNGDFKHTFIILDERLVLFGSLDWTESSFCGNCENLVCTTEEQIVEKYNEHFQDLWAKCKSIKEPNRAH